MALTAFSSATLLACLAALCACAPRTQSYDSEFLAMGTQVDLRLQADSPSRAATLTEEVEQRMLRWSQEWYPWSNAGELKSLNQALHDGKSMHISTELASLLKRSQVLQQQSDGYFDPAVAPRIEALKLTKLSDDETQTNSQQNEVVSSAAADKWLENHATFADLVIQDDQVSSTRRDLEIDLGAIAKGYALERVARQLTQAGIHDAWLNLGGQAKVIGNVYSDPVAIRDPRQDRSLASLTLKNGESISTSGDYERYRMVNHRRVHHLLDPHTGLPVNHTQAVTVVADDAALADAASTALMAAGPDRWRDIARRLGVKQVLRVDASGAIEVTSALNARLYWDAATKRNRKIVVVAADAE